MVGRGDVKIFLRVFNPFSQEFEIFRRKSGYQSFSSHRSTKIIKTFAFNKSLDLHKGISLPAFHLHSFSSYAVVRGGYFSAVGFSVIFSKFYSVQNFTFPITKLIWKWLLLKIVQELTQNDSTISTRSKWPSLMRILFFNFRFNKKCWTSPNQGANTFEQGLEKLPRKLIGLWLEYCAQLQQLQNKTFLIL